jgi:hypothetical protein
MNVFIDGHGDGITGVRSCFDRAVISGTLPDICHAKVLGGYLSQTGNPPGSAGVTVEV